MSKSDFDRNVLPNQKVSQIEKEANDFAWVKESASYYERRATFESWNVEDDFLKARRLAKGKIREEDYVNILKPFKKSTLNYFRGKIQNYPLIEVVLRIMVGEKRGSPFNYNVSIINDDAVNEYTTQLSTFIDKEVDKKLATTLTKMASGETGQPEQAPMEQKISDFATKYKDQRALVGQELLDKIVKTKDVKETFIQAYKKHWLETGRAFFITDVYKNDLVLKEVPPEDVWVHYSETSSYAEDGYAYVVRHRWGIADILKRFDVDLAKQYVGKKGYGVTRSALDYLNEMCANFITNDNASMMSTERFESLRKEYLFAYNNNLQGWLTGTVTVFQIGWIAQKCYQILTYLDELGQQKEMEVDETYQLNKEKGDIKLEKIWCNQPYQVFKIPATDKDYEIYLEPKPIEPQRNEFSNNSSWKLPINGRCDGVAIPLVLEPYQYLYNIVHKIEEETLAKDFGRVTPFPVSLLPKNMGWGEDPGQIAETFMYYVHKFPFMFYDDTSSNAANLANSLKSIDLTLLDVVAKYIELKRSIKEDAFDALGINRNRLGDSVGSEGKGKNEEQIFRSAIHTADLNLTFNKLEESVLNGLLDNSKYAYIEGTTLEKNLEEHNYTLSDTAKRVYSLDVSQHLETEYNAKVMPMDKEQEKLQALRSLAQPLMQNIGANGVTPGMISKVIMNDNPTKIANYLDKAFAIQQEYTNKKQQELQQQQQTAQKELQAEQAKIEQAKIANEDANRQNKLAIAKMQDDTERWKVEMEMNKVPDNIPDHSREIEQQKIDAKRQEQEKLLQDNERQRQHDSIESNKDRELKEKELKAKNNNKSNK